MFGRKGGALGCSPFRIAAPTIIMIPILSTFWYEGEHPKWFLRLLQEKIFFCVTGLKGDLKYMYQGLNLCRHAGTEDATQLVFEVFIFYPPVLRQIVEGLQQKHKRIATSSVTEASLNTTSPCTLRSAGAAWLQRAISDSRMCTRTYLTRLGGVRTSILQTPGISDRLWPAFGGGIQSFHSWASTSFMYYI